MTVLMRHRMDRKKELGMEIAQGLERWNRLRKFGGDDPFQPDGLGMNLIRKRIVALKKECETELDGDYPPEYHIKLPEEVKEDYMARSDEIRKNAKKSLKTYEKNPDYLWLAEQIGKMDEAEIRETGIRNVVDFPDALRFFIKTGSLVDMRRHENPERYPASFRRCRARVETMLARTSRTTSHKAKTELKKEKVVKLDATVPNAHPVPKRKRKRDIKVAEKPTRSSTAKETIPKKAKGKKGAKPSKESSNDQKKEVLPVGQLSMFDIGII